MTRLAALPVLALLAACAPDCRPPAGATAPNVVLVTVDTLRADHVGPYGGTAVPTPTFDRLAADGVLFARAYSQTQSTTPSHITIMTSLPIAAHGVSTNGTRLPRPVPHLPALLRAAGWRTAGVVGSKHLGPGWALGDLVRDGFETLEVPKRVSKPWDAEEVTDRATRLLRDRCGGPVFLWVHYWDPHMPYRPPAPYAVVDERARAADGSMDAVDLGWVAYDVTRLRAALAPDAVEARALQREFGFPARRLRSLLHNPVSDEVRALDPEGRGLAARLRALGARTRRRLPLRAPTFAWLEGAPSVAWVRGQYAGEVAYVDAELGRLRRSLDDLGIADRTVLVVLADHGESLGEHGVWFAHMGLHEANLRIPFVVTAPGRLAPARRPELVDTLDVAPTILALVGLPRAPGMQGRDLFAGPPEPRPLMTELSGGAQLAVREERWKLVTTLRGVFHSDSFVREAGTVELYDLAADPAEAANRALEEPARTAALLAGADAWRREMAAAAPAVPTERAESLRALGYVE